GLFRLSGNDFRAGMFFNAALLSATAALLILAATRVRGRIAYSDLFFPLVLLHWGHADNMLWCWQVGFVTSTFLVSLVLAIIVGSNQTAWKSAAAAAVLLALLGVSGANGLLMASALLIWLVWIAVFDSFGAGTRFGKWIGVGGVVV